MAEGAQDASFVEEPLNCELEIMPHHGGGEGQGCGGRSLWCGGIGVGEETFRGSGKRELRCIILVPLCIPLLQCMSRNTGLRLRDGSF